MKVVYIKDGVVTTNHREANTLVAFRLVNGCFERSDYSMNGPLRKVKTFKDLNQTILEGNYLEYDNNGNLQVAGFYVNNIKTGKWYYFKDSGSLIKTEKFLGPGVFDETGNYYDSLAKPMFKGGKNEWRNYLHESLNRDAMINILKDETVKISFTITATGTLKNFIFLRSEYFAADNEIIRVFSNSPKWSPAVYNGKTVDYRYTQVLTLFDLFHEG